ncbi:MAG TPA: glycosyl hydrolase, partial [Chloroflexota bacterium]
YNQPTAQMYHVTTDSHEPYRIYGSQQDNSAIALAGFSSRGAITAQDWFEPGGGESGYIAVRPDNTDIVIGGAIGSGAFNGRLVRYDRKTGQERDITVWPNDQGMGDGADTLRYRFQWTFPIFFSPLDPDVLYVAANKLLRSRDEGTSWEEVSPDLTRNDPKTLKASGGPITKDNTGAEVYGTIFACVESPHEAGVIWAGSDDGLLHLSRDGGATWSEVTPGELPEWSLITNIEVSPHDANSVYVCATRYKHDDTRPYLYKTKDGGVSWQLITSGIPEHEFTRVICADPGCRDLLFAGTETGLHVSFDDGASWSRMHGNLPTVPIYDLIVHDTDLIAATHGRSFWVLDDLTPLRALQAEESKGRAQLIVPRPARRLKVYKGWGYKPSEAVNYRHVGTLVAAYRSRKKPDGTMEEEWLDAGKNPPVGVVVTYFLPQAPSGDVVMTFIDENGQEIRRFSSAPASTKGGDEGRSGASDSAGASGEGMEAAGQSGEEDEESPRVPAEAGLNRFVWDMRYPEARKLPGDKSIESTAGPVAVPGQYTVRLALGVEALEAPFEIIRDPRVDVSIDELRAQFALAIDIRDKLTQTHEAVISIRDLLGQVEAWQTKLSRGSAADTVRQVVSALKQTLLDVEDQLVQRNPNSPLNPPSRPNFQLAALLEAVQTADAAPTQGQYGVFEELKRRVDPVLQRLQDVVALDLAEVNAAILRAGVPPLVPRA